MLTLGWSRRFVWEKTKLEPEWTGPYAAELYDHTGDHSHEMDNYENANLAQSQPALAKTMCAPPHCLPLSFAL